MKESTRRKRLARRTVIRWLLVNGVYADHRYSNTGLIKLYAAVTDRRFSTIREVAAHINPVAFKVTKPQKSTNSVAKFYRSPEWRRVRYDALAANDGRCELCGISKHDGAVLNVDHIKPLRHNWEKRLDPDNLQVLCGACNHGKGNRDTTDWRAPRLATLMGERIA